MSHPKTKHTCAICPKPIGPALLMCAPHWHLVPRAMQNEVYRTWGRVSRPATPQDKLQHHAAYRKARDAAVEIARDAAEPTTGETE